MEHRNMYETEMKRYVSKGFKVFFMLIIFLVLVFLMGYVVMWLWNWLMPTIFGLTTIGYWQAIGLLALSKILFGLGNHSSKGKQHKKAKRKKLEDWCNSRREFSEWKHYDQFWKEEGEQAYKAYVQKIQEEDKNEKE